MLKLETGETSGKAPDPGRKLQQTFSLKYQATDCESVPYQSPAFFENCFAYTAVASLQLHKPSLTFSGQETLTNAFDHNSNGGFRVSLSGVLPLISVSATAQCFPAHKEQGLSRSRRFLLGFGLSPRDQTMPSVRIVISGSRAIMILSCPGPDTIISS
jgi:hypothetical protein